MEVVTREANANDLDRAAEVLGEAFADYPWTRWTVDAAVPAQVAELEGRRHAASKLADDQVEHLRPQKHHLYLGTVGTSRAMQGRGLATKTLAPLLQTSDRDAVEVWLETSSESNVDFYRRLGFGVERHLAIQGGGPAVWLMSRQPESGAVSGN